MNIYHIDNQLITFFESLPDTGEISEDAMVRLEQLQLERKEKQKNIILYKKNLDRGIEAIDNEIRHLEAMKRGQQNKSDRLMSLLEYSMGDEQEVNFDTCGAKYKKNPPRLVIEDESAVPDRFRNEKVVVTIDKVSLKKEIQDGLTVKGVSIEQGRRLDIY